MLFSFSCPYSLSESDQRFASDRAASALDAPSDPITSSLRLILAPSGEHDHLLSLLATSPGTSPSGGACKAALVHEFVDLSKACDMLWAQAVTEVLDRVEGGSTVLAVARGRLRKDTKALIWYIGISFSNLYGLSESDQRFSSDKAASALDAPLCFLVFEARASAAGRTRPLLSLLTTANSQKLGLRPRRRREFASEDIG